MICCYWRPFVIAKSPRGEVRPARWVSIDIPQTAPIRSPHPGVSMKRFGTVLTVVAGLLAAASAPPVQASFHEMKIREIFPGTAGLPNAQYVMLQMYSAGQNLVGGHFIRVYDASGGTLGTFTFPMGV